MRVEHPIRGRIDQDDGDGPPTEKFYKPHFLSCPPAEVQAMDGKFVRLDVKVSYVFFNCS